MQRLFHEDIVYLRIVCACSGEEVVLVGAPPACPEAAYHVLWSIQHERPRTWMVPGQSCDCRGPHSTLFCNAVHVSTYRFPPTTRFHMRDCLWLQRSMGRHVRVCELAVNAADLHGWYGIFR